MRGADAGTQWRKLREALAGERLPCALVDLDAFDANAERMAAPLRRAKKTMRIATKSMRCPELIQRVLARHDDVARGLMTFTAAETAFWAARGAVDLLLGYPTAHARDAEDLATANISARAATIVDDEAQLAVLASAALRRGVTIPVAVELDVAFRPMQGAHLGVRRSPLRSPAEVVRLAGRIAGMRGLSFAGLMGYEAHIAGLGDKNLALRALKRLSRPRVVDQRGAVVDALVKAGLTPKLVNGGGTGSVDSSAADPSVTEVTIGSAFLAGHLFDDYEGLGLLPALMFALQVVRRPADGLVTCHGGGIIASGAAGADRLPIPVLPAGMSLLPREGAGEVQTPLRVPRGVRLNLGDPVLFRPAKSGEPAERFKEFILVRGTRIEGRAPTYRGLGECFL